jgi:hypothetical protein
MFSTDCRAPRAVRRAQGAGRGVGGGAAVGWRVQRASAAHLHGLAHHRGYDVSLLHAPEPPGPRLLHAADLPPRRCSSRPAAAQGAARRGAAARLGAARARPTCGP